MTGIRDSIVALAQRAGFVMTGFSALRRLDERAEFLLRWLGEGRAAEMRWLAREPERRLDPRLRDPRLRSVISLAYPYAAPAPPSIDYRAELRGKIAAYAFGTDYHDLVLDQARQVARQILDLKPGAVVRLYVDTGPVLEREWAASARLGWFGRNTNLINRYRGSYFLLAEIFTDLELAGADEPYRDHCGTCRQCLDLCPTGALSDGLLLDSRLCISYLTIEHRGAIPPELRSRMGSWVFGCDVCQEVCPWNADTAQAATINPALAPHLGELMVLDDVGFRRLYGRTAVRRTKRRGLLRNAAIALGNTANPAAVPILIAVLADEPEALVRAHAAWALGRLGGVQARAALDRAWRHDIVPEVHDEIVSALEAASA